MSLGDVLTIVRAQEGTTAYAFSASDRVEMLITAGHFEDLRDKSVRVDRSSVFNDGVTLNFGSEGGENIVLLENEGLLSPGDSLWDSVTSLIHLNGTNGSTTFTDVKGNTITPTGNAQISTAQSVFEGSSAYFDGVGDYLSVSNASGFMNFGTGNFTIEFWFRSRRHKSIFRYADKNLYTRRWILNQS